MKALSLRHPWAWFIFHGGKDIENRGWTNSYRGPVLIHTSKWWDEEEIQDDFEFAIRIARDQDTLASPLPSMPELKSQCGHIVGVVNFTGSVVVSQSPWFFGPKGFLLEQPLVFVDPVPCRGDRGLFEVSSEIASTCRAQIDLANQYRGKFRLTEKR